MQPVKKHLPWRGPTSATTAAQVHSSNLTWDKRNASTRLRASILRSWGASHFYKALNYSKPLSTSDCHKLTKLDAHSLVTYQGVSANQCWRGSTKNGQITSTQLAQYLGANALLVTQAVALFLSQLHDYVKNTTDFIATKRKCYVCLCGCDASYQVRSSCQTLPGDS